MNQQQLPLAVRETRLARIDRIAEMIRGPVDGQAKRANVYFDERAYRDATAKAKRDNQTDPHPPRVLFSLSKTLRPAEESAFRTLFLSE